MTDRTDPEQRLSVADFPPVVDVTHITRRPPILQGRGGAGDPRTLSSHPALTLEDAKATAHDWGETQQAARTLAAYALNLARGHVLAEFELDHLLVVAARVGVTTTATEKAVLMAVRASHAATFRDAGLWRAQTQPVRRRPWWRFWGRP